MLPYILTQLENTILTAINFNFFFLLMNLDYADHYYFYFYLAFVAFNVTSKLVRTRIWSFGFSCTVPQNSEADPCYRLMSIEDGYV